MTLLKKRTIRPVTPYPGSPLYYDAIEMGLLDKENPAEDFYERKHLNSDLICCNFTELSDDEFYETLRWANTTLMRNYFDKQKASTLKQVNHLYTTKDVSFRGFRHNAGSGQVGFKFNNKAKVVPINKNKQEDEKETNKKNMGVTKDKTNVYNQLVNWENTSSDGERFSQRLDNESGEKSLKSYDSYLKKKEIRAAKKDN